MKRIVGMIGALLLLSMSDASASGPDWYVGAHGEFSWVRDTDVNVGGANIGELSFDLEYAAGISVGYIPPVSNSVWDNTRWEIEAMYRETDFDNLTGVTAPGGVGGSIETYTAMANAYYDVDTGTGWAPYVGGGIGVAQHDFDSITTNTDDTDIVLAYQAMAGISYSFEDFSGWTVGLGYRYYGTQDPDFTTNAGASLDHEYDGHNLEYSIRYQF